MSEFVFGPRDRAREGAIVGAALLGVGGLALRYILSRNGGNGNRRLGRAAEAGAFLALTGAIAGALIGGTIAEPDPREGMPEAW